MTIIFPQLVEDAWIFDGMAVLRGGQKNWVQSRILANIVVAQDAGVDVIECVLKRTIGKAFACWSQSSGG